MATEENVNPTEGQEQENDYRETLLVRNPDSGQVEAVSKLVTKGDRREVHTVQPLAKNRPAFYPFRSSNAVAAFIRGFKSQKDNPIQFQFLKVPVFSVGKIVTSLGKLVSNPKSEEGWETYNKYVVNTAELEQVKYDKVEIPRAELQELGIDFDALPQRTQRSLMLGLPTRELFPATVQLSDHGTTTGLFNLSFYRDHNDELKFRLDTPLVQPEYEREEYASEITPDDKVLLMCLAAIHHRTAAQFFGVRANTLAALTGTVAVGAEAALTDNWTVETSAYWNPIRTERLTTQVGAVQLGVRHWFYEDFVGHFLGLHASWVDYRIGNRRRTYDGRAYGIGISYGYAWILSKRWNLVVEAGTDRKTPLPSAPRGYGQRHDPHDRTGYGLPAGPAAARKTQIRTGALRPS